MRTSFSPRRLARYLLVVLFVVSATVYSILWIIQIKHSIPQDAFTNYDYSAASGSMKVGEVIPGGAAEKGGLRAGDRILAINGLKLKNLRPFYESIVVGQSETVELTVADFNSSTGQRRIELVVHGGKPTPPRTMQLKDLLDLPMDYYPLGFLVVGVAVLMLRPDDTNAWLLALLFGGYLAGAPLFEGNIPPPVRGFVVFYKLVMSWSGLALFYYFFAVFPAPSPMDRKLPWLKYVVVAVAIVTTVPIGLRCLLAGGTLPLYLGLHWPGAEVFRWVLAFQTGLPAPAPHAWPNPAVVFFGSFIGAVALGLASLISNSVWSADAQVQRKTRVMLWGTVLGTAPVCLVAAIAFFGGEFVRVPLALWQISVFLLSTIWPLSFAYAVAKHRVLEIPVLLRRSARYVLVQRGYLVFLFAAGAIAIAIFTHTIARFFAEGSNVGMTISALFGIVLVWASAPIVKHGTARIDRAFFRSAYDARMILQDLAEKARAVTDRRELARLLETKIAGALRPKSLACYLEAEDGSFVAQSGLGEDSGGLAAALPRPHFPRRLGVVFIPEKMDTLPGDLSLLHELTQRGKAWDVPQAPDSVGGLTPLTPECLVPMLGRDSRLIGLLVLGQRLSEEPYSKEDKDLLDSVASQAGITLENIHLAEKMAVRLEAERRASMEMDFARRVQIRLFPQKLPALATLDYVGGCVQARQVGGDYYDFLDMGPGTLGIVLADISGKGMSGALLMANLQANLRSQYAVGLNDLPGLLQSVNRLFYENTTDECYATMFFGIYEDSNKTLRYANCGHIAPLILHTDGTIQRLVSTTTVLGLFLEWESPIKEVNLCADDLLVICTDGVTEAPNAQGEDYGEVRLAKIIEANRGLAVSELLASVQASVQQFSGPTQADDITLIVARCH